MMYQDVIRNAFAPLILDDEKHSYFFNNWELVTFERNELITEAGRLEKYFYVVLEGVQVIYILTADGEKKVIGFSYNGSFSGIYDSFLSNKVSRYFLEAVTPSKLVRISKKRYDDWLVNYPEFNKWGRILHQELLIGRVDREVELITKNAKQRFECFMKRCPRELRGIPQKYLASYLNMTPETYSRLRADKS
ncbi:MAG: Crp/Fnr family transcriptional regulator [Crocinitomicaceae bacterium]|nr:Crp/Fnr family transcriptional regulator [Crocinitomicaceae bacterium]